MNLRQQLDAGITELGIDVAPEVRAKLVQYVELISKWNRVHNLTAIRGESQMVSSHLLDCLVILPHLSEGATLDVGSGAGLPGILLALMWPRTPVFLLDSNHKKAAFLRQASVELGLGNVRVVCERVESWAAERRFDLVISRALAEVPEFLKLAGHHCRTGGTLATMKGVYPHEELAHLPAEYSLRWVTPLKVPGLDAERHLVVINRLG